MPVVDRFKKYRITNGDNAKDAYDKFLSAISEARMEPADAKRLNALDEQIKITRDIYLAHMDAERNEEAGSALRDLTELRAEAKILRDEAKQELRQILDGMLKRDGRVMPDEVMKFMTYKDKVHDNKAFITKELWLDSYNHFVGQLVHYKNLYPNKPLDTVPLAE